jgi:hypothetical protein
MKKVGWVLMGLCLSVAFGAAEALSLNDAFTVEFPGKAEMIDQGKDRIYHFEAEGASYFATVSDGRASIRDEADLEKFYGEMAAGLVDGLKAKVVGEAMFSDGGLKAYRFSGSMGGKTVLFGIFYYVRERAYGFYTLDFSLKEGADPFGDPFFASVKPAHVYTFSIDQKDESDSPAYNQGYRIGYSVGMVALPVLAICLVIWYLRKRKKAKAGDLKK